MPVWRVIVDCQGIRSFDQSGSPAIHEGADELPSDIINHIASLFSIDYIGQNIL